ncbi:MAG: transposase [bacterium]
MVAYSAPIKIHHPRPVHLLVDATYWGERTEDTSWCSVVARDQKAKENLWWSHENTESTSVYLRCRQALTDLGYTLLSVTGDGFSGIKQAFQGIPFQMCLVHMERLVIRGTTRKPELEAGRVLLALARSLHKTNSQTFNRRLEQYIDKYRDFLNEKTTHPVSGEWSWTHESLRMAVNSLVRLKTYLFTFEKHRDIPKTTNSLEGHFRHMRDITSVHCGLGCSSKEKLLHSILLAGSIAPSKKKLNEIL